MARTLADLKNGVLRLIGESSNTTVADVGSGTGAAATVTTAQNLTQFLNEGIADLCRTCFYVPVQVSKANYPVGQKFIGLHEITDNPSRVGFTVWSVRTAAYNGATLRRIEQANYEVGVENALVEANAAPKYLILAGPNYIGLGPAPAASQTLTVGGAGLPPKLVNDNDPIDWLPDDLARLPQFFAAIRVCEANAEEPTLAARVPEWIDEYNAGRADLYDNLSPAIVAAHYPKPPVRVAAPN